MWHQANSSKVDKILNWPVPKNSTDVYSFLGLISYVSVFLPKLANFTSVLTPLTTKEACKEFPEWMAHHQSTFKSIKSPVVSHKCLTTIDHQTPSENNIYVTCDASNWHTSATLSFSPSWETTHPVAFD